MKASGDYPRAIKKAQMMRRDTAEAEMVIPKNKNVGGVLASEDAEAVSMVVGKQNQSNY